MFDAVACGRHVCVMEGVIRCTQFREKFERGVGFHMSPFYCVAGLLPWPVKRALPEHVPAGPYERVPVTDRQPQVIFHALAENKLVAVVMAVGVRDYSLWAVLKRGGERL